MERSMSSGLAGYEVRLDDAKLHAGLIPEGGDFSYEGVESSTDYSERVTVTAVDNVGNRTTRTLTELGLELITADPTPGGETLPASITEAIDAIVAAKLKPTPDVKTDGALVGVTTADGSYYQAYGGDRTAGLTLTLDHKMRYGSITKMYTALLVLAQVDAGHLSLDDTLDQFVSGVANGNTITVQHLLQMQSGILDYNSEDAARAQQYFLNPTAAPADILTSIRGYTPLFAPGTKSQYSNSNYFLLGLILEWIDAEHGTGRDIRTIMYEDCLQPLGLDDTEWPTGVNMTPPYSRAWTLNLALPQIKAMLGPLAFLAGFFGYPTSEEFEFTAAHPDHAGASGVLDGTIADLVAFGEQLRDGALLSPEMLQLQNELFVTYTFYEPKNPWEGPGWLGFGLGVIQWASWLGWIGNFAGYVSVLMVNRGNGAVIAACMNHMQASTPVVDLFYRIAYLLYPETTLAPLPGMVRPATIASSASVNGPSVYVYHEPGDEDGNTDVPLKVPFYI